MPSILDRVIIYIYTLYKVNEQVCCGIGEENYFCGTRVLDETTHNIFMLTYKVSLAL